MHYPRTPLKMWMFKNRVTHAKLAKDTGVTIGHIDNLVGNRKSCSWELAQMISEYTRGEVAVDEIRKKSIARKICPTCGHLMRPLDAREKRELDAREKKEDEKEDMA